MTLPSVTPKIVRTRGGEAALTLTAAPAPLGRPFLVSLVLALAVSGLIVALARHPASQVAKLSVVAPTLVQRVIRSDEGGAPILAAALRYDPAPSLFEPSPADEGPLTLPGTLPDPNEIVRFGSRQVKRWLVDTLLVAARTVDSDPALLMAIADKESSFSPTAKARTSSAEGLFQFIDRTWLMVVREFGAKHGLAAEAAAITVDSDGDLTVADAGLRARILRLRRDPKLAAIMAAEMLKRDSERIGQRVGRSLSSGEVYLAHFLGPHDAARFLNKVENEPGAAAAKLLPRPARANRTIFFAAARRRAKSLSVADVHRKFEDMMQTRIERFRSVDQFAGAAIADAAAR